MLIRNVSIFSFILWVFFENQRPLVLVWGPEDRIMSSIYWKMGEKAVILEERVARFLYYYAKFYKRYTGLLGLYQTYRFSLFQIFRLSLFLQVNI